ncbi:ORF085 [Saltwater crocodilepox virus]|nr:ORF084 [Saltwater crocodilepox virus]QGT47813.1 ORF085 [Saltwater crocodilepox virus]QGT48237.1 ORF084 [Saltwater crocodilepox virus]QGT48453.1 ORF084 [Saltwater crocodilepox virus]QGT48667.1 ORF084 [Saltwater crocodilepox virus]
MDSVNGEVKRALLKFAVCNFDTGLLSRDELVALTDVGACCSPLPPGIYRHAVAACGPTAIFYFDPPFVSSLDVIKVIQAMDKLGHDFADYINYHERDLLDFNSPSVLVKIVRSRLRRVDLRLYVTCLLEKFGFSPEYLVFLNAACAQFLPRPLVLPNLEALLRAKTASDARVLLSYVADVRPEMLVRLAVQRAVPPSHANFALVSDREVVLGVLRKLSQSRVRFDVEAFVCDDVKNDREFVEGLIRVTRETGFAVSDFLGAAVGFDRLYAEFGIRVYAFLRQEMCVDDPRPAAVTAEEMAFIAEYAHWYSGQAIAEYLRADPALRDEHMALFVEHADPGEVTEDMHLRALDKEYATCEFREMTEPIFRRILEKGYFCYSQIFELAGDEMVKRHRDKLFYDIYDIGYYPTVFRLEEVRSAFADKYYFHESFLFSVLKSGAVKRRHAKEMLAHTPAPPVCETERLIRRLKLSAYGRAFRDPDRHVVRPATTEIRTTLVVGAYAFAATGYFKFRDAERYDSAEREFRLLEMIRTRHLPLRAAYPAVYALVVSAENPAAQLDRESGYQALYLEYRPAVATSAGDGLLRVFHDLVVLLDHGVFFRTFDRDWRPLYAATRVDDRLLEELATSWAHERAFVFRDRIADLSAYTTSDELILNGNLGLTLIDATFRRAQLHAVWTMRYAFFALLAYAEADGGDMAGFAGSLIAILRGLRPATGDYDGSVPELARELTRFFVCLGVGCDDRSMTEMNRLARYALRFSAAPETEIVH